VWSPPRPAAASDFPPVLDVFVALELAEDTMPLLAAKQPSRCHERVVLDEALHCRG
jgi:hypothetical protein